jgi:hypothetical protein
MAGGHFGFFNALSIVTFLPLLQGAPSPPGPTLNPAFLFTLLVSLLAVGVGLCALVNTVYRYRPVSARPAWPLAVAARAQVGEGLRAG